MKVKWVNKVNNERVLNMVHEKRSMYSRIVKQRDRLVGHIFRHERLVGTIMEGKVGSKERRGRPKLEYVEQVMEDVDCRTYLKR